MCHTSENCTGSGDNPICIFWVDDDKKVLKTGTERFRMIGFNTITCDDPTLADREYVNFREKIDLVLLDLNYKRHDIDGTDVIRRIQARDPFVPVWVLSGYLHIDVWAEKIENLAIDGCIDKPLSTSRDEKTKNILEELERAALNYRYKRNLQREHPYNGRTILPKEILEKIDDAESLTPEELDLFVQSHNAQYLRNALLSVISVADAESIWKTSAHLFADFVNALDISEDDNE